MTTTTPVQAAADRAAAVGRGIRSRGYVAYLAAAAIVPLLTASLWYSVLFGDAWVRLSGVNPATALTPGPWPILGQLARNAVVVAALTVLARRLHIRTVSGMLGLALLVWLGFQAMSVLGGVLHEGYPLPLYLIHVGDALQSTLVMATLIGLAQRRHARP
jgi:hypothetical protein